MKRRRAWQARESGCEERHARRWYLSRGPFGHCWLASRFPGLARPPIRWPPTAHPPPQPVRPPVRWPLARRPRGCLCRRSSSFACSPDAPVAHLFFFCFKGRGGMSVFSRDDG